MLIAGCTTLSVIPLIFSVIIGIKLRALSIILLSTRRSAGTAVAPTLRNYFTTTTTQEPVTRPKQIAARMYNDWMVYFLFDTIRFNDSLYKC